jgi:hypothetical protein
MKLFTKKRSIIGLIAVVAVVAMSVGAYAYFTTTGQGTGAATVGASQQVTLHGTTAGLLYPGGPSRTVSFTVDNPSPGNQFVGTIKLDSVDTGVAGCDGTWFTMPDVNASQQVAPGNGDSITATGQLSFNESGTDQSACKNATLTLNLSST